jgi:hypothetical protein
MVQNNPLKQYFRQPAIYIRLPSGGEFYPEGTLDMPPNGELPVYPMTAIDEITYRTPDALFNGSATTSVIQSCVPNIRNPWAIPAMDVDTILVSIRIASYGHNLELESTCPSCKNEDTYTVDLRNVIDSMKAPDYRQIIQHRDLEIYFKPMSYQNLNDNNQRQFEEQRMLQSIGALEGDEQQKINALTQALKKITEVTVEALAQSISAIKTPQALVTESEYIVDFLKNCDRALFNKVRDHIVAQKGMSEIQPLSIRCHECDTEYSQMLTLDMSNFFAPAS